MKTENRIILLLLIALSVLLSGFVIFSIYSFQKMGKEVENCSQDNFVWVVEDQLHIQYRNGIYYSNQQELFNPQIAYEDPTMEPISLEDMSDGELQEFLKYFLWLFPAHSKQEFTKDEKSAILALAASESPVSQEYINFLAKYYFGVSSFDLSIGTYHHQYFFDFTLQKDQEYYFKTSIPMEFSPKYAYIFEKREVEKNQMKVYFTYFMNQGLGAVEYHSEEAIGRVEFSITLLEHGARVDQIKNVEL